MTADKEQDLQNTIKAQRWAIGILVAVIFTLFGMGVSVERFASRVAVVETTTHVNTDQLKILRSQLSEMNQKLDRLIERGQ